MRPKLSFYVEGARLRTRRKLLLGARFPFEVLPWYPGWKLRIVAIGWEGDRMVIHVK